MKIKIILGALAMLLCMSASSFGQVKIGYTNIELILAYMPEAKTVESSLGTYQKKLAEKLKAKDDYAQTKLQEYMELSEANRLSPTDKETREKELMKLDEEIKKLAEESEFDLLAKRQELLGPVLEKLQTAINTVAKENGYTYVLNQTTSAGVSTILYGPEEDDLTEKIMAKLNIPMPKGE